MVEHDHDMENPEVHHEGKDIRVKPIYGFVVIFIAFMIVSYVGLAFLLELFRTMEQKAQPAPVTMVRDAKTPVAPEPRLQPFGGYGQKGAMGTPEADMKKMREEENAELTSYGWVDQQKGIVRIPIAQAIDITAQQGFPVRQTPAAAAPSAPGAPTQQGVQAPAAPRADTGQGQARSPQQ
jgi:hypothetical protein